MPADSLLKEKKWFHVYNRGVEGRNIFSDADDYQTFESFLAGYLSPAEDPKSLQKTFTVHGRTFKGTPHQPKNYSGKVDLIAYGLMPDHFHLILQENSSGQIEGLIRSLGTRYSMYFNKKYSRSGSLFEGPYKSKQIKEKDKLLPLANHIHHGHNEYSSYPEYSGKKETSWVNKNIALSGKNGVTDKKYDGTIVSSGNSASDSILVGKKGHQKSSKNTSPDDNVKELMIESDTVNLARRDLTAASKSVTQEQNRVIHPTKRWPEVSAMFAVFLLLFGLGLRNVTVTQTKAKTIADAKMPTTSPTSQDVLSATSEESPTPTPEPKLSLVVKTTEGFNAANVRSAPDVSADKIADAPNGSTYEIVAQNGDWYEIKLENGLTGFIYKASVYIEQND